MAIGRDEQKQIGHLMRHGSISSATCLFNRFTVFGVVAKAEQNITIGNGRSEGAAEILPKPFMQCRQQNPAGIVAHPWFETR